MSRQWGFSQIAPFFLENYKIFTFESNYGSNLFQKNSCVDKWCMSARRATVAGNARTSGLSAPTWRF